MILAWESGTLEQESVHKVIWFGLAEFVESWIINFESEVYHLRTWNGELDRFLFHRLSNFVHFKVR